MAPIGFQNSLRFAGWWIDGSSIDLDFVNNRCFTNGQDPFNQTTQMTDYLSCTRASTGTALDRAGNLISFGNNVLRITNLGLLIEDARTNNLLNSDTPATQTTASLSTGSYTLWVNGTGSALASAGTATISGAASATDGNPNTFSVTVAGTVVVTVTGSLTRFQLENGAFASSYIPTTGTTVTRAADQAQVTGPLLPLLQALPMSIVCDVRAFAVTINYFVADSSGGWKVLNENANDTVVASNVPAGGLAKSGINSFIGGTKIGVAMDSGARSLTGSGLTPVTDTNAGASGGGQLIALGCQGNVGFMYGLIRRATFWSTKISDASLQAYTT